MKANNENRSSLRIGIKQLTSIIKKGSEYVVVKGDDKINNRPIKIIDISTGGLCIESKQNLKSGVGFHLEIPKIGNLEATPLETEATRSVFREDPQVHLNLGTEKDKSYYEVGLKFKKPNTKYLKQLYELALTKKI